ncbi:hypothetical protein I3843_03G031000 [Carya illinoinensis]|nr:hypothetical protein I3760_03G028000 [Carya illinoinensis]KAG7985550.1 hypothetical protein I3843_03G031000 [Carya illinoinensis]
MALKALLFLFTCFIVVTSRVSSKDEELATKAVIVEAPVPSQAPAKVPAVKAPTHAPPAAPTYAPPPKETAPVPPVKPPAPASPSPLPVRSKKDCIPLCDQRCQLHSRKRLCTRACMTCCDRCKCVPPGTFGNREKCGKCYTDMTTHGNKYKCP